MTDIERVPVFQTVMVRPANGIGVVEKLRLQNIFDKSGALIRTKVIDYSHGADLASRE